MRKHAVKIVTLLLGLLGLMLMSASPAAAYQEWSQGKDQAVVWTYKGYVQDNECDGNPVYFHFETWAQNVSAIHDHVQYAKGCGVTNWFGPYDWYIARGILCEQIGAYGGGNDYCTGWKFNSP